MYLAIDSFHNGDIDTQYFPVTYGSNSHLLVEKGVPMVDSQVLKE